MLLGDLRDAIAHLDAHALDEAVVVLFSESRTRHLPPAQRRRLLATEEHRLDPRGAAGTRRLQRRPHVADKQADLWDLTANDPVVKLVAILEQRVVGRAVDAALLARTCIQVRRRT